MGSDVNVVHGIYTTHLIRNIEEAHMAAAFFVECVGQIEKADVRTGIVLPDTPCFILIITNNEL